MTEKELKELLTPEFLSTLHIAVISCGWDVDMVETMNFCNWCYNVAGQPEPDYNKRFDMDEMSVEVITDKPNFTIDADAGI